MLANYNEAYLKGLTPTDRLLHWIKQRNLVKMRKAAGKPKPWTDDTILQQYRFCNVRREDDKVTKWIATYWREPNRGSTEIWFAMVVARLVNWPETLVELTPVLPWSASRFVRAMNNRQRRGDKVFTGAYMIHADATHGGTKAEYLAEGVLNPLWKDREAIRAEATTLANFFQKLRQYRDMGEFMCGQVIADTKYTDLLNRATDWWTWATPGPGSRRGLNRVLGYPTDTKLTGNGWYIELTWLIHEIDPQVRNLVGKLHAQDYQNCLCEFDKYERVLWGEGKPRSKYPGV